jgi:hypothetical protein
VTTKHHAFAITRTLILKRKNARCYEVRWKKNRKSSGQKTTFALP